MILESIHLKRHWNVFKKLSQTNIVCVNSDNFGLNQSCRTLVAFTLHAFWLKLIEEWWDSFEFIFHLETLAYNSLHKTNISPLLTHWPFEPHKHISQCPSPIHTVHRLISLWFNTLIVARINVNSLLKRLKQRQDRVVYKKSGVYMQCSWPLETHLMEADYN